MRHAILVLRNEQTRIVDAVVLAEAEHDNSLKHRQAIIVDQIRQLAAELADVIQARRLLEHHAT
jgi:hypothetical protein